MPDTGIIMKSFHSHKIRRSIPWQNPWVPQTPLDDATCISFDHTGSFLACALSNGIVELWDTRFVPVAIERLTIPSELNSVGSSENSKGSGDTSTIEYTFQSLSWSFDGKRLAAVISYQMPAAPTANSNNSDNNIINTSISAQECIQSRLLVWHLHPSNIVHSYGTPSSPASAPAPAPDKPDQESVFHTFIKTEQVEQDVQNEQNKRHRNM